MSFSSTMEEDDYYPKSLQEELNEIIEAFYAMITEDDIKHYQTYIESIEQQRIAEGAVQAFGPAPDFVLQDQDDETVHLSQLLQKGPVVLIFYRGKWCPHCNATLMAMQRILPKIQEKGASMVAISPMLPDGTYAMATKRDLQFPVLSDFGNKVARQYKLTFKVPEECRPAFEDWGEDVPLYSGDCSWEIPLPATYILDTNGNVVWSFIDNDPGCRAEPEDIVAAIPDDSARNLTNGNAEEKINEKPNKNGASSKKSRKSLMKKSFRKMFGKKKEPPEKYLGHYLGSET